MAKRKKAIWLNKPGEPIYRAKKAEVMRFKNMIQEVLEAYDKFDDAMCRFSEMCINITIPAKYMRRPRKRI
jgi:hypothetical protein